MIYEVWETRTGNMIGTFETQEDALTLVRDALHDHGRDYLATWALGTSDNEGEGRLVAEGPALADLASVKAPA